MVMSSAIDVSSDVQVVVMSTLPTVIVLGMKMETCMRATTGTVWLQDMVCEKVAASSLIQALFTWESGSVGSARDMELWMTFLKVCAKFPWVHCQGCALHSINFHTYHVQFYNFPH